MAGIPLPASAKCGGRSSIGAARKDAVIVGAELRRQARNLGVKAVELQRLDQKGFGLAAVMRDLAQQLCCLSTR